MNKLSLEKKKILDKAGRLSVLEIVKSLFLFSIAVYKLATCHFVCTAFSAYKIIFV